MNGVLGKLQAPGRRDQTDPGAQDDEVVGIVISSDLTRRLRRWRTLEGSVP
jgi:hypothetical protein